MEDELRQVWGKPFRKSSVAKDLPRLAGRIVIEAPIAKRMSAFVPTMRLSMYDIDQEQDKLEVIQDEPPPSPTNLNSTHTHIKTAIIEVARNVESREQFEMIKREVEAIRFHTDWELEMKDLFSQIIGEESKTAKVFKAITQNILFSGCVEIKQKIPMHTMTRDVRGPEGWKILVSFTETVSVTHFRREQSLATAPPTEQFWFEWRLHMIFDKEMNDMQASSLKITNLGFGDQCTGPARAELSKMLGSGNLIVS